mgnify:CR=1 FL=1
MTPARRAAIALGANVGDRSRTLDSARAALRATAGIEVLGAVADLETPAHGAVPQPDFLNGMVLVRTTLSPGTLLDALHAIEAAHGRVRDVPKGPRTLDLDLVWMEGVTSDDPSCVVPHPALLDRPWLAAQLAALCGRDVADRAVARASARPVVDPRVPHPVPVPT